MSQSSIERLRDYLGQLPPKAQALLMREFERAIERGEDVAVANFVLEQLRMVVRAPSEDATPRTEDPMRRVFRPLEPFLVENVAHARPGQIRRSSLGPVWLWLGREGCPEASAPSRPPLRATRPALPTSTPQFAPSSWPPPRRLPMSPARSPAANASATLGRLGATSVVEDIGPIGAVLSVRDSLKNSFTSCPPDPGVRRIPHQVGDGCAQPAVAADAAGPAVRHRAGDAAARGAWQIIRLGIMVAGSDDEIRVAGTPFGITVTMALHDLSRGVRTAQRHQARPVQGHLQSPQDAAHGIRGLRTELDLRSESAWGKQLASIRSEISNALQSEIDNVPGRVRRLLRQGPDKEVTSANWIDPADIEETAAMIDFVAVCRTYASELAINEVSLRAYTELQHYVEKATETLVESLRTHDQKVKAFRLMQMEAAIRFCNVLFGPDYASLMSKAPRWRGRRSARLPRHLALPSENPRARVDPAQRRRRLRALFPSHIRSRQKAAMQPGIPLNLCRKCQLHGLASRGVTRLGTAVITVLVLPGTL